MSSSAKEAKFAFLEGERQRSERHDFEQKAQRQLADEGKMGFCGTDAELREQRRKVSARATELQERDQYERLREKYG